jgi:cysteine desulfurase
LDNIRKVYIDYNATTPLKPEVKAEIINSLDIFGNASSMHQAGRQARARIEEARRAVARLIGAQPREITFTSGGSETNNTVFQSMCLAACGQNEIFKTERNEFIISAVEHPCVLNSAAHLKNTGFKVIVIPVDQYGKLKIDELKKALNDKTLLVSVMAANNEIGTVQDIKEITALVKQAGAFMHCDAVQAVGKIKVDAAEWGVDYLTVSAHKIYGPKGVGAMYVRKGAPVLPLIHGGHQEDGLRAGTYNNTGIIGFGKAAEIAFSEVDKYQKTFIPLREKLRISLVNTIPDIKVNGHSTDVLPNTLNVSFPGAEGESILLSMDMLGIEASTGSACASGSLEPSHVLLATGAGPELAHGSIRFSLGWGVTGEDIEYIIEKLPPVIAKLRAWSTM